MTSMKKLVSYITEVVRPKLPEPSPTVFAGRYVLHSRISYGGLSLICGGRDTKTGQEVAVKFPRPENFNSRMTKEFFRDEVTALSLIKSPIL